MATESEQELVKMNGRLRKILDGSKDEEHAYGVFEVLERLEVDATIINNSRIAITINDLRKKTSDDKLAKRGKALIRKWKTQFEDSQTGKKPAKEEPKKKKSPSPPLDDSNPPPRKDSNLAKTNLINNYKMFKHDMPKDEKRAKIVDVLLKSLKSGELPDHTQDPEAIATRIEAALFERFGDVSQDYYSAARSRASNLRDKKNPHLRENVLTGAVNAEHFSKMSTEEMASDAMKTQREAFTKDAILEHQMSVQEGTATDMFKCGRCGQNNCTYTQLQTRSSDEVTYDYFCLLPIVWQSLEILLSQSFRQTSH
ncbi:Transcription elongation factor [Aphelenchoides bicaudatus]|nr:Transcription elongation factor [Aphelenchoides bicaudatus]